QNDRRLSEADKSAILRWVEAGALEGDSKDLPAAPQYTEGWTIGQPDVVLSMQEDYPIPAAGTIPYSYFEVPTNFTEDKWVQAFEVRPGDRSTVHHVIVFTKSPQPAQAAQGGQPGGPREGVARPQPTFKPADGMDIPDPQAARPTSVALRTPVLQNDR